MKNPQLLGMNCCTLAAIGLCLATSLMQSTAADKTWNGGGDGSTMTLGANWDGGIAPVANDQLFFSYTTNLGPNYDFTGGPIVSNITFNAGAGAFTLTGNGIRFPAGAATFGVLTNLSPNTQTISAALTNNGGPRIYRAAAGPVILDGVIVGNTVVKEGASSLTISGPAGNAGSPAIVVNEGLAILSKAAGNAFATQVTVHTNGTVRIVGGAAGATDQIHFNTRVVMNGGVFQHQHFDGVNTIKLEEIASLSGSNLNSIIENGLANSTNRIDIGGGNNHRGIYSGTIRDGAAGVLAFRVYRGNNYEQLNGTNTYTGTTSVDNTQGSGAARLIVNGAHIGGGIYTVNANAADRFAYLHGSGVISASAINLNQNAYLSPGGYLSADLTDTSFLSNSIAILTISNAVNLNTSSSTLEIELNGPSAGISYDQIKIAGSGTISNSAANLKITLGYTPAPGDKFTIVDVEGTDSTKTIGTFGSINGVGTSLAQGATVVDPDTGQSFRISYRAEGSTFDMGAGNGNNIMLEAISPVGGAVLTWRGDAGYDWDITTTASWRNTNGVASTFTNSDFVTFGNAGSNASPINLTTDLTPATILVSSSNNYEFGGAGKLTGLVIITKTNTGKLTITTDNDNSGAMLLRQGALQIGTNGTSGLLSGNVNMRTNSTLIFNRSDSSTFAGVISGDGIIANNSTNGTITLTGNSPFSGGVQANAGVLQFGDGTGVSGAIAGRITNNAQVTYNFNNAVTINNSLSGTGAVNLVNSTTTSRRYTLPTTLLSSTFSGTFNVGAYVNLATADQSTGTNQLGIGSTVNVADGGSVYLDRNGIYRTTFNLQGAGNGAGSAGIMTLEIEQGATIVSNVNLLADATIGGFLGDATISGRILGVAGTETLTFANRRQDAQSYNLRIGTAAGPNHWGSTIIEPGDLVNQRIRVTALASRAISTNGLTIGAHGIFALNGFDHTVASLANTAVDGAFYPTVFNGSAATPAVFTVGTDDTSTTFDGIFGDGSTAALGVTKVGAGTLTLSGNSTSSGALTVGSGTIALSSDGSFSNATTIAINSGAVLDVTARFDGNLNLQSGQTLKGSGGLNGNLVTLPGSVVNPGASIGTLTVSNNATLGGTLRMEVNRASAPNCDRLNVVGSLTAGGTLQVTNIGPALQANNTFQLFPSGVSGFTVSLPAVDAFNGVSYTWQNNLAGNGSVTVLTVSPLGQPVLTNGVSGNTINFSWSGPYKLQAQTNTLSVGISNNWGDYPGGGGSSVSVTINPANRTVFFRLAPQ